MQDCDDPAKMYPDNGKGSDAGAGLTSSATSTELEKRREKQAASARARQARVQAQLNERMAGFGIIRPPESRQQQRGEGNGRQKQHASSSASAANIASATYLKSLYGLNVGEWEPVRGELQTVFPTNTSAVDYRSIVQKYYFP